MSVDKDDAAMALKRVQKHKAQLKREMELFYIFVFGVFFGIITSLVATFWDATVRGVHDYPGWYVITICTAFIFTLFMLFILFNSLRQQRRDLDLLEENFEEIAIGR